MLTNTKRWRADPAARLALDLAGQTFSQSPRQLSSALERLLYVVCQTEGTLRRIRRSEGRGWGLARERLLRHLLPGLLSNLKGWVDQTIGSLAHLPAPEPILAGAVLADLKSLEEEFDDFRVEPDLSSLNVVTDPVTLEEIPLGRFRLVIDLSRLCDGVTDPGMLISAEALDPNPAATDETVTHPHVRDGCVCLGEATMPLRLALQQARFADAMQIVRSVLNTYNEGSPYVALEDWHGQSCDDCGRTTNPDDSATCRACDTLLCGRCAYTCDACEDTFCRSCLHESADELLCHSCHGVCDQCNGTVRKADLHDGVCTTCREQEEEHDDQADQAEPTASAPADPGAQPQAA